MNSLTLSSYSDEQEKFNNQLDIFLSSYYLLFKGSLKNSGYDGSGSIYSSSYEIIKIFSIMEEDMHLKRDMILHQFSDLSRLGIVCDCLIINDEEQIISSISDREIFISFYQKLSAYVKSSQDEEKITYMKNCISSFLYSLKLSTVYCLPELCGLDYHHISQLGFNSSLSPEVYFDRYAQIRELCLCWDDFIKCSTTVCSPKYLSLILMIKERFELGILNHMGLLMSLYHSMWMRNNVDISGIMVYDFGKLCSSSSVLSEDVSFLCARVEQLGTSTTYSQEAKNYLLFLMKIMKNLVTKQISFYEREEDIDENTTNELLSQYHALGIELSNTIDRFTSDE